LERYRPALEWIDAQLPAMRRQVIALAEINSHTPNALGVRRVLEMLAPQIESLGAPPEWLDVPPASDIGDDGNPSAIALGPALRAVHRADAPLRVLLNIHADTVYPADHPFERVREIDGNTLNGPGVIDAKGGLVVMLTALAAAERSGLLESRLGWEILINPDEEIGSPGSIGLLNDAAKRNHLGLLFEPAMGEDGALVGERKGSGNFTIIVRGRSAHAGRDFQDGRNAVVAAAELVARVHALNDEFGAAGVTVNVGRLVGGGAANVVPDLAFVRINVRVTRSEDVAPLKRRLSVLVHEIAQRPGIRAELHGDIHALPKTLDERTRRLADQIIACGRELGLPLSLKPSGGVSDGNKLAAAGLPNIDSLGPRGGKIHSPDEFLLVDSLAERAKLTSLVLMKLATGDITMRV
jgi:glutamate carboxypeptidase